MKGENQRVYVRVMGRVQGVGYRYFARDWARRLGLTGWVRNAEDGSVEGIAEGPKPALQAWIDALRKGPPLASVDNIEVTWLEPQGDFQGFSIRF